MSSVIVECPLTNDQSMTVMILQEYLENDEVFDIFQAAIRNAIDRINGEIQNDDDWDPARSLVIAELMDV